MMRGLPHRPDALARHTQRFDRARQVAGSSAHHQTQDSALRQGQEKALHYSVSNRRIVAGCAANGDGDTQSQLAQACQGMQQNFFELCVQNMNRPAAAALADFVRGACVAHQAGASLDRVGLMLEHGGHGDMDVNAAGYRLTASERRYRQQWLDTVYATLDALAARGAWSRQAAPRAASAPEPDAWLISIVRTVLAGQASGEEQAAVVFDRALATAGASGGCAAEKRVIAPQWIPASQLVLLTVKVARELRPG